MCRTGNSRFGDWVCNGVETYAKANGVTASTVIFDPGKLDGNAIALQIAASNPEAVVLGMPRGMMLPILTAAEQQDLGKNIKWELPTSAYHSQMPKAAGKYWDGKLYVHMELEPLDKDAPDMKLEKHYGKIRRQEGSDQFVFASRISGRFASRRKLCSVSRGRSIASPSMQRSRVSTPSKPMFCARLGTSGPAIVIRATTPVASLRLAAEGSKH